MRIALLGTRGIPASYGGFETFAEELSKRLVRRGHAVSVYCRTRYSSDFFEGVRLVYLPTIRHKYFDTIAHTFISTIHLLFRRADVALYCNGANAIFTIFPRLTGIPVALNVDGLERQRKKWNRAARTWYLLSEWLATFLPTAVVADAATIADYYRQVYGKTSYLIAYGAEVGCYAPVGAMSRLGLEAGKYFLYVTRMEPENNPLLVREAFETLTTDYKLVIVGDAPYASEYIRKVRNTSDPRVILPGAIYGEAYRELQSHCFAYVHATEVGGTHPALIEAMGRGALVAYLDTPENTEVAGGVAVPFTQDTLPDCLRSLLKMPAAEQQKFRAAATDRVAARYSWDAVTSDYEALFRSLSNRSS